VVIDLILLYLTVNSHPILYSNDFWMLF
jgi:hypothetical protein